VVLHDPLEHFDHEILEPGANLRRGLLGTHQTFKKGRIVKDFREARVLDFLETRGHVALANRVFNQGVEIIKRRAGNPVLGNLGTLVEK
jgi:hypothetical protein